MDPEQPSPTNIPLTRSTLSTLPRNPLTRSTDPATFSMSSASSTPSFQPALPAALPTAAKSAMALHDDTQATPTPKDKKCHSESSLSTMTPPDSIYGTPVTPDDPTQAATESKDIVFVKSQDDDDVFGRNSDTTLNQGAVAQSDTSAAIAKIQANLTTPVVLKQVPRADRMNSPITPANAQGVLPPEACVFVANLATVRTDEQLEVACHNHFDVFGECHIKVRRDKHGHPFALVQYHNVEDANSAIRSSHNVVVDGRLIRCEHAQARRAVVLTRVGGGNVSMEEAKEVLKGFGPIAKIHPTTHSDARELGLPAGVWAQFEYYLDYKDCLRSFNTTSTEYRVNVPPEVEARTRAGPGGSPVIKGFRTPRSTTDQKSIFVGNLPSDTSEHTLRSLFSGSGMIRAVNIIHKPIHGHGHGGQGYNVFGFVEFSTISEAEAASHLEVEINGAKIRVEPKEYSARRHTRLQQYTPVTTPFYRTQRNNFSQIYGGNQGMGMNYSPGFYAMQSPPQMQTVNELNPFHHHQGGFSNIYATPPPSNRMGRRNEMLYTGSPHHMQQWSPAPGPYIAASGYAGGMMQIPEELEGQRY